jgi:hypothetical protein
MPMKATRAALFLIGHDRNSTLAFSLYFLYHEQRSRLRPNVEVACGPFEMYAPPPDPG